MEKPLTIRESLLAMGYSERKPGYWLKPIGYQMLTYNEVKNELCSWFVDATDTISLWERKAINNGDYCLLK